MKTREVKGVSSALLLALEEVKKLLVQNKIKEASLFVNTTLANPIPIIEPIKVPENKWRFLFWLIKNHRAIAMRQTTETVCADLILQDII